MATTIEDVLNSIKKLAENQDKGNREVNQKFKEVAEARRKSSAEVDQKFKEVAEARRKSSAEVDQKFKEVAEARRKGSAEVDQKIKEVAEAQKEVAEAQKELDKSLNKFIGKSGFQWGKFIETLASTGAVNALKQRGIQVETTSTNVKDERRHHYEIDSLAVNGKEMVAIEAKKYLQKKDVDEAMKRFKRFKTHYKEAHQKILYGAVAYLECEKNANLYAEEKGLFVFQVTGNSAVINNREDFQPEPLSPSNKSKDEMRGIQQ